MKLYASVLYLGMASAACSNLVDSAGGDLGAPDGFGPGPTAQFNRPQGVAANGAVNLYVTDTQNGTIRQVAFGTGAVTTLAGTAGVAGNSDGTGPAAQFRSPYGVAADNAGNLFVADAGNCTIRKLVLSTGAVTTLAGTAGMCGNADGTGPAARFAVPYGVAADAAGNLNGDYASVYIGRLMPISRRLS
jgi:hypothetical protein